MTDDTVTRHIVHLLKERSISITDARVRITAIIYTADKWISLADILHTVNNEFDRATVYRVLCLLHENGFLYKLVDMGKISYYMFNKTGNVEQVAQKERPLEHTWFKCLNCGRISVLPGDDIAVHLPEGFTKTASNLLISGYCNNCASARN